MMSTNQYIDRFPQNNEFESQLREVVQDSNLSDQIGCLDTEQKEFKSRINELNTTIVLSRISLTNELLKNVGGESAPQLMCFTNIENSPLNFFNRYFIQIFITLYEQELNILRDPYLLIEMFFREKRVDLFWSNLEDTHKKQTLLIDEENVLSSFEEKFSIVLLDFVKNNLNSLKAMHVSSEYAY